MYFHNTTFSITLLCKVLNLIPTFSQRNNVLKFWRDKQRKKRTFLSHYSKYNMHVFISKVHVPFIRKFAVNHDTFLYVLMPAPFVYDTICVSLHTSLLSHGKYSVFVCTYTSYFANDFGLCY